ncbi:PREDICTED: cytochrome P450 724B1 [Nelumbo nucifera]|uniref:Cytochrome P450 724B1 n=2 Tax=Nelumbo nucifera TaxID=4432 RepID=A0A1U7Z8C2_NELNU|nr:PREDICTED: cytochrome P450 724B1 [Nelumbo nucifera]DAD30747.1 TPA_asm: hypothetical protein HUJ06_009598 [Nelumbo nucifera]
MVGIGVLLLLPLLLATSLGLVLAFVFLQSLFLKQEPINNLPHGSMGWPFQLGETLAFLRPHQSNTRGSFLDDHCSRYGKIFKSHLFGCPTIVSCDHELNMFILQNEEKLFQCSYPKPIHGILGKHSLLVVVGDVHKKLRSFALSLASTCKSKPEYLHDIEKLAISLMESWKERKEVMFYEEAKKFTFNLIVKEILSMEPEDPVASKILKDFLTFMKGLVSLPIYIPGTPYAKAVKARARISSTVSSIIKEREKVDVGLKKGDFLDVLLSNASLNDEGKVSIVLDLLLGGYETTSILMALTVYFLAHSPHALEHLKEEHEAIRKYKPEKESLNWEDYKQMEFTQNVINEALRCGNVVKFVHRKAIKDVNFKGYFIPSGWKVLPIFTAVHLDPSLHENASEFNPWRWVGQAPGKNFSPFGGGLRLCPGAELAKVETAFFLHHLVLNYRWRTKGEDYPLAYPYVEFKRGLLLEMEPLETRLPEGNPSSDRR